MAGGGGETGVGLLAALLIGLALGSFATLLSARLPRGEPVLGGRSRCPACSATLRPMDLVPVLSWLLRRGRCRACGAAIGARYPLIELATAALCALAYLRFGATPATPLLFGLTTALVAAAVADWETGLLPNPLVAAVAVLGLAGFALPGLGAPGGWADGLLGAALTGGIAWALRWGFHVRTGRHGLGLGDVKLLAAAGLWSGLSLLPALLVIAGLGGVGLALIARRGAGQTFPFGPALALALLAVALWPDRLAMESGL